LDVQVNERARLALIVMQSVLHEREIKILGIFISSRIVPEEGVIVGDKARPG